MVFDNIKKRDKDIGKELSRQEIDITIYFFTLRQILIKKGICSEEEIDKMEEIIKEIFKEKYIKDAKDYIKKYRELPDE